MVDGLSLAVEKVYILKIADFGLFYFYQTEQERHLREEEVGMIKLFFIRSLRVPLLISVVLQLSQQLSGINGVSVLHVKLGPSVRY